MSKVNKASEEVKVVQVNESSARRLRQKAQALENQKAMVLGAQDEVWQSHLETAGIPQEKWKNYRFDETFTRLIYQPGE